MGAIRMAESLFQLLTKAFSYIRMIGIFDVIDIAIVAFALYHAMQFIRRSRSGQLAKAIFILFFVLGVANLLNLRVVTFFLRNAVELGLISLVIIFQPEIRRFLERMGSGRIKELFVSCLLYTSPSPRD